MSTTFEKVWTVLGSRMINVVFYSGYNAITMFLNQQKKSLTTCREREILQTHYPLYSTVRLSVS